MLLFFIHNGKCKHAIQIVKQRVSLLFIEMHQHFGIALSAKAVTLSNQFFANLDVVVYLAIQNDPDRLIFIADRLSPTFKIYDRETAMHKQAAYAHVLPARVSVGTTMREESARLF